MKTTITPHPVELSIKAPASKSFAQRAVAAALLSAGRSELSGVEPSADTLAALQSASRLGAKVSKSHNHTYIIEGPLAPRHSSIDIGESGLSTRLFTPIAALWPHPITITGHGSILARPMEFMRGPLEQLGVSFQSSGGSLPLTVCGPMRGGGRVEAEGSLSSQFISGLLFALPLAQEDTTLVVSRLTSRPYIDITLEVLHSFGVEVENRDYQEFFISAAQSYHPTDYTVEGDWSGASCPLVAGALGGRVRISGLNSHSVQADRRIMEALEMAQAGVEYLGGDIVVSHRPLLCFDFDATQCPDLFPALVALASACHGSSRLVGTERLIHKESNRALTLRQEFGKMGIEVDIDSEPNTMIVTGGTPRPALLSSHGDHRIAMAVAVAALRGSGVVEIEQAEAVEKSYPRFWDDISR
ncbi:MAG: 3-phosphoshikimate 1-carboxyvinyltransferase [Mucinivorans sp.]